MNTIATKGSLIAAFLFLAAAAVALGQSKTMNVTVREAPVRATPSFLGAVVADLSYGTPVEVIGKQDGWLKVRTANNTGWMHSSELTEQRLALKAGSNVSQGASGSEVALAGKGFNKQVEDKYRSTHNLDYGEVDKMEKDSLPPKQLVVFLEAGDLNGGQN